MTGIIGQGRVAAPNSIGREAVRAVSPRSQRVQEIRVPAPSRESIWNSSISRFTAPRPHPRLPTVEKPAVLDYIEKYLWLAKRRLPQFAQGTTAWWLEERNFFGGLRRERIWVFWRRVLHTCHHRTQVQAWLRLAGHEPVPAIYGPSGDVKGDAADPTYSPEAAKRGATGA